MTTATARDASALADPHPNHSPTRLLTVAQVADLTQRHPVTVRRALESGELHGHQRVKGGRWTIAISCATAWALGDACPHPAARSGRLATVRSIRRGGAR